MMTLTVRMMNSLKGDAGARDDLMNAVILVDKPEDMTSYDVVRQVKRIAGTGRVGHAGTLDRFASGLLVLCTGTATKLARFLLEDDKSYTGTVELGVSTDTDDREGAVTGTVPTDGIGERDIIDSSRKFIGPILQVPPTYSALKVKGRRASDRARNGENVNLAGRTVTVYEFDVTDVDMVNARFDFRIRCSKGTYIRSIARDMGIDLGTGAHLGALRRTDSGHFSINDALSPADLESYTRGGQADKHFLRRPAEALEHCGRIVIHENGLKRVFNGAYFDRESVVSIDDKGGKVFIIMDENENLIAIADVNIKNWQIAYLNVFNPGS